MVFMSSFSFSTSFLSVHLNALHSFLFWLWIIGIAVGVLKLIYNYFFNYNDKRVALNVIAILVIWVVVIKFLVDYLKPETYNFF